MGKCGACDKDVGEAAGAVNCCVLECEATLCVTCAQETAPCSICEKRSCADDRYLCETCQKAVCSADATMHLEVKEGELVTSIRCETDQDPRLNAEGKDSEVVAACLNKNDEKHEEHMKCWGPELILFEYKNKKFPKPSKEKYPLYVENCEREHPIPVTCFLKGARKADAAAARGKEVTPIEGAEQYNEDDTLTYYVTGRAVTKGTEHNFLTDKERSFSKILDKNGMEADLRLWLSYMEAATVSSLLQKKWRKREDEHCDLSDKECARAAAHALFKKLEEHYVNDLGISLDTRLRNGVLNGTQESHEQMDKATSDGEAVVETVPKPKADQPKRTVGKVTRRTDVGADAGADEGANGGANGGADVGANGGADGGADGGANGDEASPPLRRSKRLQQRGQ